MNPGVTYEMDYYTFEQEIIFTLSRVENVQKTVKSNLSGKRNLDNIIDP